MTIDEDDLSPAVHLSSSENSTTDRLNLQYRALGYRSRERRVRLGLTEDYVAYRIGISSSALRAFEAGNSVLPPANLASLAAVLMVRVTWFFAASHDLK